MPLSYAALLNLAALVLIFRHLSRQLGIVGALSSSDEAGGSGPVGARNSSKVYAYFGAASGVLVFVPLLCHKLSQIGLAPDLAAGKSWKTSSTYASCDPVRRRCGGQPTAVFFHTAEDDSPWIEIDLGSPRTLGRIDVRNRMDCCQDRAVPLLVEVSEDESSWREIARKDESFMRWEGSFAPCEARYVRLRVPRKTFLHLEEVAIR
jgi:hypothetical protein